MIRSPSLEKEKIRDVIRHEMKMTRKFIEKHVSDHSPVAYMQNLLKKHKEMGIEWVTEWRKSFLHTTQLINRHEGKHESLWMYRRQLLLFVVKNNDDDAGDGAGGDGGDGSDHKNRLHELGVSEETEQVFCYSHRVKEERHVVKHVRFVVKFVFPKKQ